MPPAARRLCILLWVLPVFGVSCSPSGYRPGWGGEADREENAALVRFLQARDEIEDAWELEDWSRLEKMTTEDVVFVPPEEITAVGREAALDWFRDSRGGLARSDVYVTESVDLVGEWAVESWSILRRLSRPEVLWWERLKGMHLYRRQPDGRWLLAYRIWNSSSLYGGGDGDQPAGFEID